MTIPNTAANGGKILTDERIAEIADATGMMAKNDVLSGLDGGLFCIDFARAIEADLRASFAAVPASEPSHPDNSEVPYLIVFDDHDRENELVIGDWRAAIRFKQISGSWNAHLFVKIAGNNRDDKTPCYAAAPAPVSGMPDLASLDRWEFETYDQGGNWIEPNITGEYVRFADVERLLNPTKELK